MAHGLVLRMKDMIEHKVNERPPGIKNPLYPASKATNSFVDEVNIIQSWISAIRYPKNSKIEYFTLLRQTLMFMFSPNWQKSSKKKDLMYAYKSYYMKFSTITPNCTDVYHAVFKIADRPWENSFLSWEELFSGTVSIDDVEVKNYFAAEPEEIVLARVHSLVIQKHVEAAMALAKLSFLYHSRIVGNLSSVHQRRGSCEGASSIGHASIDWFAFLLQRTKTLSQIVLEVQQLRCHEGIEIIYRLQRDPKNITFCYALLSILIMKDLIQPSQYCCTKKLFVLFCAMHKEMNSSLTEVAESARKIFANYAPSSSHLYLFVDVVWAQYGTKCLDLYIEMYVRGLTADINHLEAKKDTNSSLVSHLETHLSTMFAKLSTLFSDFLDLAARECMFSAFSIRPTKERLYILQSLTQNLISGDNNKKEKSESLSGYEAVRYCNCRLKCAGPCRTKLKDHALNPLLNLGVKSVSYHLIKDLVCILESARSIKFQYNMFDWQSNITELGDYLKTFNQNKIALKDWGSDTEVASDESNRDDPEETDAVSENEDTHSLITSSVNSSIKRKSESCASNPCALDVAANVEVESNDGLNKRMKVHDHDAVKTRHISEASKQYSRIAPSALETIIKATLADKNPKGHSSMYMVPAKTSNESHSDGRSSTFSEVNSHTVYPFSLTDQGKRDLSAHRPSSKSSMSRIKSSVECQSNIISNFANENHPVMSSSSTSLGRQSVVITPSNCAPVNRPVFQQDARKTLPYSIQSSVVNQVHRQVKNNFYGMQNIKGNSTTENALNLSRNSDYQRNRHLHQFPSQTSQFISSQPLSPSITSSKYPNRPSSTDFTPGSSKQQIAHDRNSVIHHTMQHVREKPIAISREVLVSLDPSSSKKQKESSKSSFKDKIFSKPEHPNFRKLIAHNPSHTNAMSSLAYDSSLVKTDALSVPGIFSTATEDNQNLQFTKITNTTITSSVKKVYKPYARALPASSKPQTELQRNAIHTSYSGIDAMQMTKNQKATIQDSSWSRPQGLAQNNSVVSSSNQDIRWKSSDTVTSDCQQWNTAGVVTSTNQPIKADRSAMYNSLQQQNSNHASVSASNQIVQYQESSSSLNLPASSSQAWYSKPQNHLSTYSRNSTSLSDNAVRPGMSHNIVSSYSVGNSLVYSKDNPKYTTSSPILKSQLAPRQAFFQNKDSFISSKSYGSSQRHFSSQGLAEVPSTLPHTQTSSAVTDNYNVNSLSDGNRPPNQSESCYNHDMYNNPVLSTDEKGVVVFRAANTVQPSHYSHLSSVSSSSSQKVCCSPLEVDPCQSCSPTERGVKESERRREQECNFSRERNAYQISDDVPFDPNDECPIEPIPEPEDPEILCHFCAFSYPASLMDVHLEEAHRNELLNRKSYKSKKKYLTRRGFSDSKILAIKPVVQNSEHIAGRDEMPTSKSLPPIQFLSETLLQDSSPQSLSGMVKEDKILASHNSNKEANEARELNSKLFIVRHKELEISWSEEQGGGGNQQVSDERQFENSRSSSVQHDGIEKTISENSKFFVFCTMCNKKVRSEAALKRHIKSCHIKPDDKGMIQSAEGNKIKVEKNTMILEMLEKSRSEHFFPIPEDINHPSHIFEFDSSVSEDLNTEAYQFIQKERFTREFNSSIETNHKTQANSNSQLSEEVDTSQIEDKMLKIKKPLKCATKPCEYCGKILTVLYMKKHILKKHPETCKVQNTDFNQEINFSEIKDNNLAFQSVSTLLQEDIDTRTCLSSSDALNIDDRFDIAAHEHMFPSDSSVKTGSNDMKFAQSVSADGKNSRSKSKSKFKKINKSSQLTLKKIEDYERVKIMGETEFDGQSKLTETYRCHICFRKYTTTAFLNKHLQNYHKLPVNTCESQSDGSTSQQKSSPKTQLISTFSECENSCKSNPTGTSNQHATENGVQFANENSNTSIVQGASSCSDQVFFMNSDSTNTHSPSQFLELEVQNRSNKELMLASDAKRTTSPEKVKNTVPKSHRCSICAKVFSYSKNLLKHMEKDHSNNLSQEYVNNEFQYLESTFPISNQQVDNRVNSHIIDELDIGQHRGTPSHGNDSSFNLQNRNESAQNNSSYSSSNPSDKVSLSKSDSFFHSNGCSSEDFAFEDDFSENIENKDSGSYSERVSFETFHASPSAPNMQFSSPCSSYNENASYHSTEQSEINNVHPNSNEIGNVQQKSRLFTEMLNDSVDTSLPCQANSFNNTMQSMSQSIYQQSNINLETSSVSTESNECPVCFKKMSTQDQLKHHIEKLHPMSSALESTIQQVDESFESQNNMFSELQQAYSVINSTEKLQNMTSKGVDSLTFSSKTPVNEVIPEYTPFTSAINQGVSTHEDGQHKQELLLPEFCNDSFGNNMDQSSFKAFQHDGHSLCTSASSKGLYTSSTVPKTNTLDEQFEVADEQGKSSILDIGSSANLVEQDIKKPLQKCDIFGNDPIMMADDSNSALKHAWMFSDLLEDFEAQTDPSLTAQQNGNECAHLSSKNYIEIHEKCHTNTTQNSSQVDNYLTSHTEKLSDQNTLKKCIERSDSKINNDVNFGPENNFLSEGDHSVSMHDIFLDEKSDIPAFQCRGQDASSSYSNLNSFLDKEIEGCNSYISPQTLPTDEHEKAINERLFSNDLENTSCSFANREQCGVDTEKMDALNNMEQLLDTEEIAKEISFLLNSGDDGPAEGLMNIAEAVSAGKDSFLSGAEEPSFINHTTDHMDLLVNSDKTSTVPSTTEPQSITSKDGIQKKKLPSLKVHTCTICSKTLSHSWSLTRHMKCVHQITPENAETNQKLKQAIHPMTPKNGKSTKVVKRMTLHCNNQSSSAILPTEDQINLKLNLNHSDTTKITSLPSELLTTSISNTNNTDKHLSQKSKKSNSTLPKSNVQHKKINKKQECSICSRELSSLSTLRRHERRVHPDVFTEVAGKKLLVGTHTPMKRDLAVKCNKSEIVLHGNFNNGSKHIQNNDASRIPSNKQIDTDMKNIESGKHAVDETKLEKCSFLNESSISAELKKNITPESTLLDSSSMCCTFSPFDIKDEDYFEPLANKPFSPLSIKAHMHEKSLDIGKLPDKPLVNGSLVSKSLDLSSTETDLNPLESNIKIEIFSNFLETSQSGSQVPLIKLPHYSVPVIPDFNLSELPTKICSSERSSEFKDFSIDKLEAKAFVALPDTPMNTNAPPESALTDDSHLTTPLLSKTHFLNKGSSSVTLGLDSQPIKPESDSPASTPKTPVSDKEAIRSSSKKKSDKKKFQTLKVTSPAKKSPKDIFSSTYPKNSKTCRFCHKVFRTFAILSCHLKIVHHVPVLKKPKSISDSKPAGANINKLSPPKLSCGSSYDSDSASALNDSFQSKMSNVKDIDKPASVLVENHEVLKRSSEQPNINYVKTPKAINDQNTDIAKTEKETKFQNEVHHSFSKSKSNEKDFIVKDNNVVKRRSQRNSCEIIMIKTSRKTLLPKKHRPKKIICIAGTQKRFGKCKNQGIINNKCNLSSFAANKKSKKTSKTIDTSPPYDNSTLPKCIIKVCKDDKNSVFYQIDNSPNKIESEEPIFQFPESPSKHLDSRIKKKPVNKSQIHSGIVHAKLSGSFKRRRKRHTVLLSTIRARKRLMLKNKKINIDVAQPSQKCNQNGEISHTQEALLCHKENNNKLVNSIYPISTFKDSKDIELFLKGHKQPIVYLERLSKTFINTSCKVSGNSLKPTFDFDAKPIVRLTRIDTLNNLDDNVVAVLHHNNKLKSAMSGNTLQKQIDTIKSISSYPVKLCEVSIKPLDLVYNKEKALEKTFPIQGELCCNTFKLPGVLVNEKCLNSDSCSSSVDYDTQKKSIYFRLIKECSVVLKRLPL